MEKIKEVNNKGIIFQLTDNPFDQTIADLEKKAQKLFGVNKFNATAKDFPKILFCRNSYSANVALIQERLMPFCVEFLMEVKG